MSTRDDKAAEQLEERFESELKKIKNEVDDLYETVYKGNGKPSLVTRVNSVEGKLHGLREAMEDKLEHVSTEHTLRFEQLHQKIENKFGRLEGWIETKLSGIENIMETLVETRKVDRAGSWQMKASLIAALAAVTGAIITVILNN